MAKARKLSRGENRRRVVRLLTTAIDGHKKALANLRSRLGDEATIDAQIEDAFEDFEGAVGEVVAKCGAFVESEVKLEDVRQALHRADSSFEELRAVVNSWLEDPVEDNAALREGEEFDIEGEAPLDAEEIEEMGAKMALHRMVKPDYYRWLTAAQAMDQALGAVAVMLKQEERD